MRTPNTAALAVLFISITASCDGMGPNGAQTLLVQHHMAECVGETIRLCLLVRQPDDPAFGYRYTPIDEFAYEWGVTYEIAVEEQSVANAATDASSTRTVLESVLESTRVAPGTQFDLHLTAGDNRIERVTVDRYRFYQEREFGCSVSECDALAPEMAAGQRICFRFAHPAESVDPLVLVEWRVCDRALVGSTLCQQDEDSSSCFPDRA